MMEVQKCYSKRLTLTALLLFIALACFAQQEMRISHVGRYIIPNQSYNTVTAMQGDTLAFYDYSVTDRVINILYGSLAPNGTIQPLQSIFSYEVPAEWGEFWVYPRLFEYKNGKLHTAFDSGAKLLVFFTNQETTDVHIFDKTGIQYIERVQIMNESSGYISAAQYPNIQTWVCSMDFETHTLPFFYQYQGVFVPDSYNFFSVFDEYVLAFTTSSECPDLIVHDGEIVQIIPGNWGGYCPYNYTRTQKLCGDYFYTEEQEIVYTTNTYIGWIEDGNLGRMLLSYGTDYYDPDMLNYCEAQSDSTFTCVFTDGHSHTSAFKNYRISNHTLIEDDFFPNLGSFQNPRGQFRMNADYLVAITWETYNDYNLILADYPQQSIRSYDFTTTDAMYSRFYHSDSLFYWFSWNGVVHIFRLEMALDAADELLPPVFATLKAYPNPFRSAVSVQVESDRQTDASLGVYNLRGQLVKSLHQGTLKQGESSFIWDGRDTHGQEVSAGLYLLRLDSGGKKQSTKLVHLK